MRPQCKLKLNHRYLASMKSDASNKTRPGTLNMGFRARHKEAWRKGRLLKWLLTWKGCWTTWERNPMRQLPYYLERPGSNSLKHCPSSADVPLVFHA